MENIRILIDWILFFIQVFIAMIAVGTFSFPLAVFLAILGLPIFLCQIGGIVLSGLFCAAMVEAYVRSASED